jgi:hypothetical protein
VERKVGERRVYEPDLQQSGNESNVGKGQRGGGNFMKAMKRIEITWQERPFSVQFEIKPASRRSGRVSLLSPPGRSNEVFSAFAHRRQASPFCASPKEVKV